MKLELLTNATVVDDAIRFVSEKSKENLRSSTEGDREDREESDEPDYDEDKEQLEKEQEGETTGELATATINEVF
jgi:hypothetical protein